MNIFILLAGVLRQTITNIGKYLRENTMSGLHILSGNTKTRDHDLTTTTVSETGANGDELSTAPIEEKSHPRIDTLASRQTGLHRNR